MFNYLFLGTEPFNLLLIFIFIQSIFLLMSLNTVVSILLLISIYISTSVIYMIMGAEFMALALVIIYVGAISILFLFVIMMLNLRVAELYNQYTVYAPVGYFVGILFFIGIQFMMHQSAYYVPSKMKLGFVEYYANPLDGSNTITNKTNINFIGEVLYNHYYVYLGFAVLFFWLLGLAALCLLLILIIMLQDRKLFIAIQNL